MVDKIESLIKKIERLKQELQSESVLSELGETLKKQIVNRSRVSGQGVADSGNLEKFPKLSVKYEKLRVKNKTNLSSKTTPKKSNITATGSMLDSIAYEVKLGVLRLFFKNTPRKKLNGDRDSSSNSEVAAALLDRHEKNLPGGRRFFTLSNIDKKTIENFFKRRAKNFLDSIKK